MLLFRPYDHETQYDQLESLCTSSFLREADFVPQIAKALSEDVRCAPFALCDATTLVGFVNLRLRTEHEHGNDLLLVCDCLRVREDLQGFGFGVAISKTVMRIVYSTFCHQQNPKRVRLVITTAEENRVMKHIANTLGGRSHEKMHVWPNPSFVWDAVHRNRTVLDALKVNDFISTEAQALFKHWAQILTSDEVLAAMQALREQGASFQRPLYFGVESAEYARCFLNSDLAQEERRSVWRLDVDGKVQGLMFVQPKTLDRTEPCRQSLISACVVDIKVAENCVLFAAKRLHLDTFHVCFDEPILSEHILASPLLSQAPPFPFVVYSFESANIWCEEKRPCTASVTPTQTV